MIIVYTNLTTSGCIQLNALLTQVHYDVLKEYNIMLENNGTQGFAVKLAASFLDSVLRKYFLFSYDSHKQRNTTLLFKL